MGIAASGRLAWDFPRLHRCIMLLAPEAKTGAVSRRPEAREGYSSPYWIPASGRIGSGFPAYIGV